MSAGELLGPPVGRGDDAVLRESDVRFRAVWEAAGDAMALSDPDGIVLAANPAYGALYGYTPDELVGRSFAVIFPEHLRAWAVDEYRRTFADPVIAPVVESVIRTKGGAERTVEARYTFLARDGRRVAMLSVVRDITPRKQAEAEREALLGREHQARQAAEATARERDEAYALLDTLFAQAPVGLGFWDRELRFVRVNRALAEMNGLPPEAHIGKRPDELLPDLAGIEEILAAWRRILATGEPLLGVEVSGETLAAPGTLRHWVENWFPVIVRGEAVGFGAVVEEVTERKRAEERVRLALEGAGLAAWDWDITTGAVTFNERWAEIRGYALDAIDPHADSFFRGIHPDDRSQVDEALAEYLAGRRERYEVEFRAATRTGGWVWILDRGKVFERDAAGRPIRMLGTELDITERKRAEADREALLAAMTHDLRTPLTSVKGYAQMLRRHGQRAALPHAVLIGLDGIEASAARMEGILGELLDAARLRAGQALDLHARPTDLVALARRAAADHQRRSDRHSIRVEAAAAEVVGHWDAARLERVLDNLLSNAVKYSPAGGAIALSVARVTDADRAWAVLVVRDQGLGIPAADLPRVFERFYRAGNTTGRIAGSGIGLAGVRQIVEQHGGTVSAASEEGAGATFTVRLPLPVPH